MRTIRLPSVCAGKSISHQQPRLLQHLPLLLLFTQTRARVSRNPCCLTVGHLQTILLNQVSTRTPGSIEPKCFHLVYTTEQIPNQPLHLPKLASHSSSRRTPVRYVLPFTPLFIYFQPPFLSLVFLPPSLPPSVFLPRQVLGLGLTFCIGASDGIGDACYCGPDRQ